jgi:hypothetical protein
MAELRQISYPLVSPRFVPKFVPKRAPIAKEPKSHQRAQTMSSTVRHCCWGTPAHVGQPRVRDRHPAGRYEPWARKRDKVFKGQDRQGTPAAFLDGQPVASAVLDDPQTLGELVRC